MLKQLLAGLGFAAALVVADANAAVTPLVEGSGWQYDEARAYNSPSQYSAWQFTLGTGESAAFSLTDGFIPGDIYRVTVVYQGVTLPFTWTSAIGPAPTGVWFDNNLGPAANYFASAWTSSDFSHLQIVFSGGGLYDITIRDISHIGYPAGFGVRLDAVPEASTWAMLGIGFLGIGFVAAQRRKMGRYAL